MIGNQQQSMTMNQCRKALAEKGIFLKWNKRNIWTRPSDFVLFLLIGFQKIHLPLTINWQLGFQCILRRGE